MMIPGYKIRSQLFTNEAITVFRGERLQDNSPVILKIHNSEFPENTDIARLKHEYEVMNDIKQPGVMRVIGLEKVEHRYLLVLEDIPNTLTLREAIQNGKMNLDVFFKMAIQISRILLELHNAHIIHKDINPNNIIMTDNGENVKLIDFSISSRLLHQRQDVVSPEAIEATYAYMSPEQTGRMNCTIDQRTDLYSLGVTFYEVLTGQLPFQTDIVAEWLYLHMVKQPTPPYEINSKIPEMLSKLVMKLLSKSPEDRYATAYGLIADLERIQKDWKEHLETTFALGEHDHTSYFQIPQKLYGRLEEVAQIVKAVSTIQRGMILVSGYPGIGKTTIIKEAHKTIIKEHGYFCEGKFEQFQQDIPYSALIQALSKLIHQLRSSDEKNMLEWKTLLQKSLGSNAQLIVDIIPELEAFIGKQPQVPVLPPAEARTRFELVFYDFVQTFANHQHPFILFFDDMQWSDIATIDLLQQLLHDETLQNLLIICSYRDNEVTAAHALTALIDDLGKHHVPIERIIVKPLDLESVKQMVADTLFTTDSIEPLATLIYSKTGGNPFFVIAFLRMLYEEKYVTFDMKLGQWVWDMHVLKKLSVSENVVDLVVSKIAKLPKETQEALKLAACIGNQFDLKTLAMTADQSIGDSARVLWPALEANLIIPLSEEYKLVMADASYAATHQRVMYKFSHDRVEQAANSLLSGNQRKIVDIRIARLLLTNTDSEDFQEYVFEIVNHFNSALELITNSAERYEVAVLNLKAGNKAKSSIAYNSAILYYKNAVELLGPSGWIDHYQESLDAGTGYAECLHLTGHSIEADKLFSDLLKNAKTKMDKAQIATLLTISYTLQSKFDEAVAAGVMGLKIMGIYVNPKPNVLSVLYELIRVRWRLRGKTPDDILKLPHLTDPEKILTVRLVERIGAAAYLVNPNLLAKLHLQGIIFCLDNGYSAESGMAFMIYATILVSGFGKYKLAYQTYLIGEKMVEQFEDYRMRAIGYFGMNTLIAPWVVPYNKCLPLLDKVYQQGRQAGELVYTGYAAALSPSAMIIEGADLLDVEKKLKAVTITAEFTGNVDVMGSIHTLDKMIPVLRGEQPVSYFQPRINQFHENKIPYAHPVTYGTAGILCLMTCYLTENWDDAYRILETTRKYVKSDYMRPLFLVSEYYFYSALTLLSMYENASFFRRLVYKHRIRDSLNKLKTWSELCKENYGAKYYLVLGGLYHVNGNVAKAVPAYDRAMLIAHEQGQAHLEAIACEFIARIFASKYDLKPVKVNLQQAMFLYERWGAFGKVKLMKERHPDLESKESL